MFILLLYHRIRPSRSLHHSSKNAHSSSTFSPKHWNQCPYSPWYRGTAMFRARRSRPPLIHNVCLFTRLNLFSAFGFFLRFCRWHPAISYMVFPAAKSQHHLAELATTLDQVDFPNRLSVKSTKTEYIIIGSLHQQTKLTSNSIFFHSNLITSTFSACNLGIIFKNDCIKHFTKISQIAYLPLRQQHQILKSGNPLVLVLPSFLSTNLITFITYLQRIQNILASVVCPTVHLEGHLDYPQSKCPS